MAALSAAASFDDVFKFLHQKRQGPGSRKLASGGKAVSLPKPVASQSADKQQKQFGKIGLRSSGKEITAFYIKNNTREGFVTAHEIEKGVWNIGLSKATKGYGPRLYDAVMEAVTARGGVLTAHRGKVSGHAKKVWDVYANERNKPDSKYGSQVSKVPLDPKHHTISKDPTDSLNYGYQQQPNIIKGPDIVDMNDPKYDKFLQHMQFEFLRRARGGEIPIMSQEGEFVINKHAAGQIGHSNLRKLNRGGKLAAQTLEKLPKYHSGGLEQKFKKGGRVSKAERNVIKDAYLANNRSSENTIDAKINARAATATTNTSVGVSESRISPSSMGPFPAGVPRPEENTRLLKTGLSAKPVQSDPGFGQTRQQKFETDATRVDK